MTGKRMDVEMESLIEFRNHLMRFDHTLAEEFSSMRSHWRSLGDVWIDAKYHEFGQALDEVSKGIDRYLAVTPEHEAHLLRLIQIIDEYLKSHMG